jgi:biopolymer transport protein TolQ
MDEGLWSMVTAAGGMEKAILVLLAFASVALWSIVFLKVPELYAAKKRSARFLAAFKEHDSFAEIAELDRPEMDCVQLRIFKAAQLALAGKATPPPPGMKANDPANFRIKPENSTEEIVLLSMQHTSAGYFAHMSRGLTFMATIGSTTPFIGLFGTVVGIMTTFKDLGATKNPNMQVVAPGISGALVATAAGLAVAIPAVIACNSFLGEIDSLREGANEFIEHVMAIIRANQQAAAKSGAQAPRKTPSGEAPAVMSHAAKPPITKTAAPIKKPLAVEDDEDDDDSDDDLEAPSRSAKADVAAKGRPKP